MLSPSGTYEVFTSGPMLLVRPRARKGHDWLDTRITHFATSRTDLQAASNLLFMYLREEASAQGFGGFAGHYRTGDVHDPVGPFDEHNRSVRELLNLLVSSSRGALWVTAEPSTGAPVPDHAFWTVLEYDDPTATSPGFLEGLVHQIQTAFTAGSRDR